MSPTVRPVRGKDGYWRIRSFLREVFVLNDRQEHSWHVARLDYWRWHFIKNCGICDPVEEVTSIWETANSRIVAVLHPVAMGEATIHVHPDFRTEELEQEIIALAEERLSVQAEGGPRRLGLLVDRDDDLRQQVLRLCPLITSHFVLSY